jgi:hypothetical protein
VTLKLTDESVYIKILWGSTVTRSSDLQARWLEKKPGGFLSSPIHHPYYWETSGLSIWGKLSLTSLHVPASLGSLGKK